MESLLAEAIAAPHDTVDRPTGTRVDDLTNLNWVSGTPVPINNSVSPPEGTILPKKISIDSNSGKNCENGESVLQTEIISNANSSKSAILKKKLFKTPQPTYKIILKDHSDSCSSSPGEDDSPVIFANVMNEQSSNYDLNGGLDFGFLLDNEIPEAEGSDDFCIISDLGEEDITYFPEEEMRDKRNSLDKPSCSYTCLIGMALKDSSCCLPVCAIYQYIE